MNVNYIYQVAGELSRQSLSGQVSPDQFNQYLQLVNEKFFKRYIGLPETYVAGRPLSPISWQLTNAVSDRIGQFLVDGKPINRANTGYFPFPPDYVAFSAMRYWYTTVGNCKTEGYDREVEMVTDAELTTRLQSALTPPTPRYPIGAWTQSGFRVEPKSFKTVKLSYLRMPATPIRAYTGFDVYDPANSVQFEYPEIVMQDVLSLMLEVYGITVQDNEVIQNAVRAVRGGI